MDAKRSLISVTDGMDSVGYILATSCAKLSYLSKNSFCNNWNSQNWLDARRLFMVRRRPYILNGKKPQKKVETKWESFCLKEHDLSFY